MALDPATFNAAGLGGFVASTSIDETNEPSHDSLPIFHIAPVQLQFQIASDFVAAEVANNVIVLALASGRLLRIDLYNPQDVDDVDMPKRSNEVGTIRKIFLDPTASHLLISTTHGENFYLHQRSNKMKQLSKLKGIFVECVAWSPALPSASTREILIGAQNGAVYEMFIEPTEETFRREERYLKQVYRMADGQTITGMFVDLVPGQSDMRRVVLTTASKVLHFIGKVARHGHSDASSIFTKFFDSETPSFVEFPASATSQLSISPESTDEYDLERIYAWSHGRGVSYGRLFSAPVSAELGDLIFKSSKLFPVSSLPGVSGPITSIALTQYHILVLCGNSIFGISRLDDKVIYQDTVVNDGSKILGLSADHKSNTYWVFTNDSIYEVVVKDEERDVWRIMLAQNSFGPAMRFASTPHQKDLVSIASGDYLVKHQKYVEAASIYGKSSKSFEEVALIFLENGEHDALRKYLITKLATFPKTSIMQRMMIASWLIEVYMSKLNTLDDSISAKTDNTEGVQSRTADQLETVREEYQEFVNKYRNDLDNKTTYDIISCHGREDELLYYASAVSDHNYVMVYWIQRERWSEALNVLKKQVDPEIFYKYSTVLMANAPRETVEILTRQTNLKPISLIPALLNYTEHTKASIADNQAIRYLLFVVDRLGNTDAAVHNTLLSIYAKASSKDESDLLFYLRKHETDPKYDADFALRICIETERVQSCVFIYSSMKQYFQAVDLSLRHDDIELAKVVANRPEDDPVLRKKLWLMVAKKMVSKSDGIKPALEVLKQCELLKIEDLIPFFPDFVVIDDFKEEICSALEEYSHHIDSLKSEMNASSVTAENIRSDIALLDRRYAIVELGERCFICHYPLLSRQFFVFPCQHAFHTDCLTNKIVSQAGVGLTRKIRGLQKDIQSVGTGGKSREKTIQEFDDLIAASCILCSEFAVKQIDDPFVTETDDKSEWAL